MQVVADLEHRRYKKALRGLMKLPMAKTALYELITETIQKEVIMITT